MEIDQSDDFQVVGNSQYELIESTRVEASRIPCSSSYAVIIRPTKNEVDLSIMQNQYYQFQITKKGEHYCTVQRRFSDFSLIYEILSRKQGGFIFPAFPENGLFAFMKSKVSISKDEAFLSRRIKIITRFFNIIMNHPLFDPDVCPELKEFLSQGKQFEARKQIEKGNKGIFNLSWNKLKTYFVFGKQNKYSQAEAKIAGLKGSFETLYAKCRQLMDCLREQQIQNSKFLSSSFSSQKIKNYIEIMKRHDEQQAQTLRKLQDEQFELFCQNQDLQMVTKIFDRINELKDDEENYIQLKNIEQNLQQRLQAFLQEKEKKRKGNQMNLRRIIEQIKEVGRITN